MNQPNALENCIVRGAAGHSQVSDWGSQSDNFCPARSNSADTSRLYTIYALGLIIFTVLGTLTSWWLYPAFVDAYYHMAVIEGFKGAGGLVTHAFWEMAPAGRVHIYPPALHVTGYILSCMGLSAQNFITLLSGFSYSACLLTTWLWLRTILGARPALFAVVLLCGPTTFWWNQAAHTADAAVMILAPLAMLGLESERFLVSAVLNFVVISLHPSGLFLPPALVVSSLLRRRRILAGVLAAAVPLALYSPWLAHVWANRVFWADNRADGNLGLSHGASLGLLMLASAVPGLLAVYRRGGAARTVLGPVLGFAVVVPMGLVGRFFMFDVHWPLACLGGLGLDYVLQQLESRERFKFLAQMGAVCVSMATLLVFPSVFLIPGPPGARGVPRPSPPPRTAPLAPPHVTEREPRSGWRLVVQTAALPQLFDSRGPGFAPGHVGRPLDPLHQRGVDAFLAAVREYVAVGDVIHVADPPVAALISGVAARWTTSGVLRDVRPYEPAPLPDQCDYLVLTRAASQPPEAPVPEKKSPHQFRAYPPRDFEKIFENEFGSLWRNLNRPDHPRKPPHAVLSLPRLVGVGIVGLALVTVDLLFRLPRVHRWLVPVIGASVVAVCLWPLARTAAKELAYPATPPPRTCPDHFHPPAAHGAEPAEEQAHGLARFR